MVQVIIYGIGLTEDQRKISFKHELKMEADNARKLFGPKKQLYRDNLKNTFHLETGIKPVTLEVKVIYKKFSSFDELDSSSTEAEPIRSVE